MNTPTTFEPWQQRVVEEHKDLKDKLDKLQVFLKSNQFNKLSIEHQVLLKDQSRFMSQYLETLAQRIQLF